MIFKIITRQKEWNNVVDSITNIKDICNSYDYIKLFSFSDSVELFYYCNNQYKMCIPYIKKKISNRNYYDLESVYGFSGPLSNTENQDFIKEAFKCFEEYCIKENIIAFFIRFNPVLENHFYIDDETKVIHDRNVVLLKIKEKNTYEDIVKGYSKSTVRNCKKAIKKGLFVKYDDSLEYINKFYEIYTTTMSRLNADQFYYFTLSFFQNIYKSLTNQFQVLLALDEEGTIHGGALVLYTDDAMYYFLSATTDDGRKTSAAYLLRDFSIKLALEKGIKFINFGGGRSIDKDDSLFKFKQGFSNNIEKFFIGKKILNNKIYEDLCKEWESDNPILNRKYKNIFLKYRIK